jgi:hypothetical protein
MTETAKREERRPKKPLIAAPASGKIGMIQRCMFIV